jgi:hypothetical protein
MGKVAARGISSGFSRLFSGSGVVKADLKKEPAKLSFFV